MLSTLLILAQAKSDADTGLVYAQGCAYFVTAPKGWTLDAVSAKSDGVPVCFYPQGGSWRRSTSVMYSRAVPKKGRSIGAFVAEDVAESLRSEAGTKSLAVTGLRIKGQEVRIVEFLRARGAAHERVAYLAAPKAFVLFTLTARDEAGFRKAIPAFTQLLRSYRYFGEATVPKSKEL